MANNANYRRHTELVDRMANTLGLDLEEEVMKGTLDLDSLADAVMHCTGCSNPDGCEHWMDAQDGRADQTPDICRNADLFKALKDGTRL